MEKRGWRTLALVLIGTLLGTAGTVAAAENQTAVLPFTIYSQEDLNYLQKNILEALQGSLSRQKIPVLPLQEVEPWLTQKIPSSWEELRRIGRSLGVGRVVYGSVTKIGQRVTLAGNLLEVNKDQPPQTFSLSEEGLENVLKLVDRFSKELALKITGLEKVASIQIRGSQRIESQAVERELKSKPGEAYQPDLVDQDLRAIFKMGYFSDVRVETETVPEGKKLIFNVTERPFVKKIEFKGNKDFKEEELRDQVTLKPFAILNMNAVNESLEKLKTFYQSKGYFNVQINPEVQPEDKQSVTVAFNIVEGRKVYIKTITFQGVKAFKVKQLLSIMETNEKDFLSWITSSGLYKKELLEKDLEKISAFYYNRGYLKAKVGEPEVKHEGDWLYVTIPIEENVQYKMGTVDIQGELIEPKEKMLAGLAIRKEKFYNREVIRNDVLKLVDRYSLDGFAFAEIIPQIKEDPAGPQVDLVYEIKKGSKVYFERIDIVGNTKTRDKVIRREFKVAEGGLFDAAGLRRSNENLNRLDFFEEINISTTPGSQEDRMNLKVEVKEKMTGSFSMGVGYSAADQFSVMGQIAQRNLFGRGQRLSLDAYLSTRNTRYNLAFTEPWLFDIPLSAGASLYNWIREYDEYTKDSFGGTVDLGYLLWGDFTRGYLTYTYDDANVSNVQANAPDPIRNSEGQNTTSSLRFTLKRDSRDQLFNTTKGSLNSFSVEYAGGPLGGTSQFTRYLAGSGWYFPLFWGTTFFVNGKAGYIQEHGKVPDYEKFYLGGINSIRGFKYYDIGVVDPVTGNKFGGDKMVQFNLEYIFPVIEKAGVKGVLFFDTGNVYLKDDPIDASNFKKTVGVGVRWYSPMGPLRLEWGYNIDPKPGEDTSNWDFSIGTFF
ncbi:MAG: outer membrane protein assembly factor BamA [Deltaproteobacteria bacterium]|nr:outer membrane protein assembly factor BamA [Deltaproteobacteria bacterium]